MAISLRPVSEQVIVITEASSGIGLATAEAAAEQGAKLVLAARSGNTLEDFATRLSRNGAEAMAVDADVGDRADVEQIAVAAIERFGRIDTWVNNAGAPVYGRVDEVSDQESRRLFDTNFWGVVNGSLVALRHMRANGGVIINLDSEPSESVLPLHGMYAASKQAVKGFTDALRVEVEEVDKAPVSVTLLEPTAVDAGATAEAILKAAALAKVNPTLAKVAGGRSHGR
jgi:NADP-dependent 3-hydroxy acid dehydrogenase YdfG